MYTLDIVNEWNWIVELVWMSLVDKWNWNCYQRAVWMEWKCMNEFLYHYSPTRRLIKVNWIVSLLNVVVVALVIIGLYSRLQKLNEMSDWCDDAIMLLRWLRAKLSLHEGIIIFWKLFISFSICCLKGFIILFEMSSSCFYAAGRILLGFN